MSKRAFGRTTLNESFAEDIVEQVWQKGQVVPGVDPSIRRKDSCGAWIDKHKHGDTTHNGTGWEIDHIIPVALDGSDELGNLRPLQWQNNRAKGDNLDGDWTCAVWAVKS